MSRDVQVCAEWNFPVDKRANAAARARLRKMVHASAKGDKCVGDVEVRVGTCGRVAS